MFDIKKLKAMEVVDLVIIVDNEEQQRSVGVGKDIRILGIEEGVLLISKVVPVSHIFNINLEVI